MRRGILGGTFDPPHLAHLMAGEAAYRELGLDVVTLMPAGRPWQKAGREISGRAQRWEMTRRSTEGVEYFVADDREVRRDGWTYTIDTVESFGDDELTLVLGADAAANLMSWHRAEELIARVVVAVLPRPGTSRADVETNLPVPVTWLDTPEVGISGTMLRERARAGRSIRFLVREPVWAYIQETALYD